MAPWRNCRASIVLADEINRRWPARNRASDGTIGDAAHASRSSDHNPWMVVDGAGVVRARDVDKDGIDAPWLVEFLRQRGAAGDPRLAGGGYLIFNRRITSPNFRGWRAYTGANPHTSHVHVSFSRNRGGFDSPAPWGITGGPTPAEEDDMDAAQDARLRRVEKALEVLVQQVCGARSTIDQPWPADAQGRGLAGWPTSRYGVPAQQQLTLVQFLQEIDRQLNSALGLDGRPAGERDNAWGHGMSARAEVRHLKSQLADLSSRIEAASTDPGALQAAVTAAIGGGLVITGNATPKGPTP